MNNDNSTQTTKKRDLVVTRVFDAPVELVWKAWTDPQHVMRWWGPDGFTSPTCKIDFRERGTSLVHMRSPEGQDFYNTWTYWKIVPMQQIEFILNFADCCNLQSQGRQQDRNDCHGVRLYVGSNIRLIQSRLEPVPR